MPDAPDIPDPDRIHKALALLAGVSFIGMAITQGFPFYNPNAIWGAMLGVFTIVFMGFGGLLVIYLKLRYGHD